MIEQLEVITNSIWPQAEAELVRLDNYDYFQTPQHKQYCSHCQIAEDFQNRGIEPDRSTRLNWAWGHHLSEVFARIGETVETNSEARRKYMKLLCDLELLSPGRLPARFKNQALWDALSSKLDGKLNYSYFDLDDEVLQTKVLFPAQYQQRYLTDGRVQQATLDYAKRSASLSRLPELPASWDSSAWQTLFFVLSKIALAVPSVLKDLGLNRGVWSDMMYDYFPNPRIFKETETRHAADVKIVASSLGFAFPPSRFRSSYPGYLQRAQKECVQTIEKRDFYPYLATCALDLKFLLTSKINIDDQKIEFIMPGELT